MSDDQNGSLWQTSADQNQRRLADHEYDLWSLTYLPLGEAG